VPVVAVVVIAHVEVSHLRVAGRDLAHRVRNHIVPASPVDIGSQSARLAVPMVLMRVPNVVVSEQIAQFVTVVHIVMMQHDQLVAREESGLCVMAHRVRMHPVRIAMAQRVRMHPVRIAMAPRPLAPDRRQDGHLMRVHRALRAAPQIGQHAHHERARRRQRSSRVSLVLPAHAMARAHHVDVHVLSNIMILATVAQATVAASQTVSVQTGGLMFYCGARDCAQRNPM
jgi:hypothetical protein